MRSLALIAIVAALIGLGIATRPPPANLITGDPNPPTFADFAKRQCSVEATEARRKDCFDRMLLKRAFESSTAEFERAKATAIH